MSSNRLLKAIDHIQSKKTAYVLANFSKLLHSKFVDSIELY